jgi:hypothetical protein
VICFSIEPAGVNPFVQETLSPRTGGPQNLSCSSHETDMYRSLHTSSSTFLSSRGASRGSRGCPRG